jgi:microcystin-dependent protein
MNLFAPVGTVAAYGGQISGEVLAVLKNAGWLLCDGSLYSSTDPAYAELFKLIGFSFGGDGTKQFAAPDLRARFIRGADHGKGVDPGPRTGGSAVGSLQGYATALPGIPFSSDSCWTDHTHSVPHIPVDDHNTALALGGGSAQEWSGSVQNTSTNGVHAHVIAGGGDAETRPQNIYLYYLIRFQAIPVTNGEKA